jgi:hypothetical protein
VDEVPGAQRPLLAFDEQQALPGEHEEVLRDGLGVVEPARVAGVEHAQVDPELVERLALGLEDLLPGRVADVHDEPARAHP